MAFAAIAIVIMTLGIVAVWQFIENNQDGRLPEKILKTVTLSVP